MADDTVDVILRARGPCPRDREIQCLWDGTLEPGERERLTLHIELCGRCQARIKLLADLDSAAAEAPAEAPGWEEARRRILKRFR